MRLHGRVRDFIGDEARLGNVVGFGKTLIRIAEDVVIILFQIPRLVVVNEIGLRLHRFFGIEVRRQHFVLNIDQFQRLLGDRLGDRDHASDVVPDVSHLVERERMLVVADRRMP